MTLFAEDLAGPDPEPILDDTTDQFVAVIVRPNNEVSFGELNDFIAVEDNKEPAFYFKPSMATPVEHKHRAYLLGITDDYIKRTKRPGKASLGLALNTKDRVFTLTMEDGHQMSRLCFDDLLRLVDGLEPNRFDVGLMQ